MNTQQPVNATSEARELLAEEYLQDALRHDANGYINSAENQRIKARDIMAGKAELHALAAIQSALALRDDAYRAGGEAMRERAAKMIRAVFTLPAAEPVSNELIARLAALPPITSEEVKS